MARIYTPVTTLTTSPVGQLRLIQNAFNDLKSGTVKEITEHVVKNGLVTKQDPTRVVMFYMIHLGKLGKVKEITETEATALHVERKETTTAPTQKKTAKKSSSKTARR